VVIVAQNIAGQETQAASREADTPLSSGTGLPGASKKGDYSLILLRKVISGEARDIPLARVLVLHDARPGDTDWKPPVVHEVYQFADLNGNGVMEIIAGAEYRNGSNYSVYEIRGGEAAPVLKNGWGR
jgi:hypothetical protein